MNKEIIIENESACLTHDFKNQVSDKSYMTVKDECLLDSIDYVEVENASGKERKEIRYFVHTLINTIFQGKPEFLEIYMDKLKNVSSKKELDELSNFAYESFITYFKEKRNNRRSYTEGSLELTKLNLIPKKYAEYVKSNNDLFNSILVKDIITNYYIYKLNKLDIDSLKKLFEYKYQDNGFDKMLEIIGEDFGEIAQKTGIKAFAQKVFVDSIDNVYGNRITHMCWENCINATEGRCTKIADTPKQRINQYPFIKEGYQIIGKNGIEKFVVSKCDNYETCNQEKTLAERAHDLKVKQELFMYYYDAEDLEEAHKLASEARRRKNKTNA